MSSDSPAPLHIIGFDLGHGETAVAAVRLTENCPELLELGGKQSWPTVYTVSESQTIVGAIPRGSNADSQRAYISFKYRPDKSAEAGDLLLAYAKAVVAKLQQSYAAFKPPYAVILGCPSGWSPKTMKCYETLMAPAFPGGTLQVAPESRAALMQAVETNKGDQKNLLAGTLVVDVGSSTLDFTYVRDDVDTALLDDRGEDLGAGLIEEEICRCMVEWPENRACRDALSEALANSSSRAFVLWKCREVKEEFFSSHATRPEERYAAKTDRLVLARGGYLTFHINLDADRMDQILNASLTALGGRGWRKTLDDVLTELVSAMAGKNMVAEHLVLTGGASRMQFLRDMVQEKFPGAKLIDTNEPEAYVARGLARWGRQALVMHEFRKEARKIMACQIPETVEHEFSSFITGLASELADTLVDKELAPKLYSWRYGIISTLQQVSVEMQEACEAWMKSEAAVELRRAFTRTWREGVEEQIVEALDEHCIKCGIDKASLRAALTDLPTTGNLTSSGMIDSNDPLAFVADAASLYSTIIIVVISILGTIFVAGGPLGWFVTAVAALGWAFGGNKLLLEASLPHDLRPWLLTDKSYEKAKNSLRYKVTDKIAERLSDSRVQESLKLGFQQQIEQRIERVVDRALLLNR